ncbi:hypothetical protein [Paenisporosarcina sp. TG-14]|uniref:hypothetical protein n=1 Tax=Paenisporosarcina sp. TG-14 TaxID=1231057 RepID=UPI0003178193|nr:hypothetical protein [Paenisporosarcina sp. TG-14]
MAKKKFYFAKVNVSENIFSPDVNTIINELIPMAIRNHSSIISNNESQFSFTDTDEILVNNRLYIHGNLTKAKKMKLLIKDGETTKIKIYDDLGAKVVKFIYDIENEVIVYCPTSDINENHFIKFFQELVELDLRIGEIKIIPYSTKNSIREKIKSFEVVTELNFYLIKPNPGKKEFYDFEKIIDENNLKELNLKMYNEQGIKYNKEENENDFTDSIESGLSLVESAYGTVEVKGYNKVRVPVPGKKDKINKKIARATSATFNRFISVRETDVRDIIKKIGIEINRILN